MESGSSSCLQGPNITQECLRGAGPCTGVSASLVGTGTRGRRGTCVRGGGT